MNSLSATVSPEECGADRWLELAALELSVKQATLEDEFGVGRWSKWNADLARRKLIFSDETGPRVVCDVQVAGTTGHHDWMWAWANPSFPDQIVTDGEAVRAFGLEHQMGQLAEPNVAGNDLDALGWRLAAAAAKIAQALGVYRAPTKGGAVFLLIQSAARVEAS